MKKSLFAVFAAALLLPACAFAIDGQVLINQSTVLAAGGFPYKITQPGSYKLTGNLTMSTTVNGNYSGVGTGVDIAVAIFSSDVTLDLNGFTITAVNHFAFPSHNYYAIAEIGIFSQITIRNGNIRLASDSNLVGSEVNVAGIWFGSSTKIRITEMSIELEPFTRNGGGSYGLLIGTAGSLVRDVISNYVNSTIRCPGIIIASDVFGFGGTCRVEP